MRAGWIAIAIAATIGFYPHDARTENFDGAVLTKRPQAHQDSYIQISVTMAGVVATQVKPEISSCINDWYFIDEETTQRRNRLIRKSIAKYPKHHPSAVILAILQRQCGSFK